MGMKLEAMAALILPWAKEHHPEKYTETLKISIKPDAFRKYMLRLIEIRCTEEPQWRGEVPVSVLDETSLTIKAKARGTGQVIEYKGRRAVAPIHHRILELALSKPEFDLLQRAKDTLDLEYIHDGK